MSSGSAPNRAPRQIWLPVGLFLFALLLRLGGIGWGLKNELHNQSYHPDEPIVWMQSQRIEPAKLQFTPHFYNYGTLYLTVLRVASDVTAAYTGNPDPKSEDSFWSYVSRCHLAGRLINAFAGAGTVLLIFLMLRRLIGDVGAGAGGLALAVSPAHVVHSRFQTVDVFAVFLLVASMYFALRLVPSQGDSTEDEGTALSNRLLARYSLLSAAFAGLSAGTKYTGILALLVLFTVLFVYHRRSFLKIGLLSTLVSLLAFFLATPGALLDTNAFLEGVQFEMAHTASGHGIVFAGTSSGFVYHLGNMFNGMGILLALLGIGGLVYGAIRRQGWSIALLLFFVAYYVLIGGATDKYMRYALPLFPLLATGVGIVVARSWRRPGLSRLLVALVIMAIGGLDFRGLLLSARYTAYMAGEDPRDSTARYLKSLASETSAGDITVGLASNPWFWNPPLFPNSTTVLAVPIQERLKMMSAAQRPKIAYYVEPSGAHHPFDVRLLREMQPDFVTYSTLESDPLERVQGRQDVSPDAQVAGKQYAEFQTDLKKGYDLEKMFGEPIDSVEDMQYIQPVVYLWKRK